ncbi:MAG: hypothetical protein ACRCZI_01715, partial [Cetobacterium sp.]
MTSEDLLRATLEDLQIILLNPPTETYIGHLEQSQQETLLQMHEILNQIPNKHYTTKAPTPAGTQPLAAAPSLGVPKDDATATDAAPSLGVPINDATATPRRSNRRPHRHGATEPIDSTTTTAPKHLRRSKRPRQPPQLYTANTATTLGYANENTQMKPMYHAYSKSIAGMKQPTTTFNPKHWTINPQELNRFVHDQDTNTFSLEPGIPHQLNISQSIGPSEFVGMAFDPDTGKLCEYRQLSASSLGDRWKLAFCIEWGRLFQGYQAPDPKHSVQGTNTCRLIH